MPSKKDPWAEAMDKMDRAVAVACRVAGMKEVHVDYSAYSLDGGTGVPVNNLSDVAVEGKVRMIAVADEYWGGKDSQEYRSEVLESPTWLAVAVEANRSIPVTKDEHHVFLEGIRKLTKSLQIETGVTHYEMLFGS